jgi:predicted nucleic acid-binding protein
MSTYLLDTTVLIRHLRDPEGMRPFLLGLLADGHALGTSCVNVAEVERGLRPGERDAVRDLLDRLRFLVTTREAAARAGRYQAEFGARGRTIEIADALIAGTARAHGAILLTDNLSDFPMADVTSEPPPGLTVT